MNSKKLLVKIVENWPAKVLSIAIALILFVFHRMSTTATRPLSVPLILETNAALVPASSYPQNVRIQLRGEDEGIKSIADGDIEAYVDFSRYDDEGLYRAPVQIRKKGSALGIEPMEISVNPLEVSIHLDRRIVKNLPVAADIRGKVASGFEMVTHAMSPSEVIAAGPSSILGGITALSTDPINLDGRNGDFNLLVNVVNPSPFVEIRGSGMVDFFGLIHPSIPVRNIEGIPITFTGLKPHFVVDSSGRTGTVRLEGGQSQLDSFKPSANFLTVDCSALAEQGIYTLPVKVNLPRGLSLIRSEPEEITFIMILLEAETPSTEPQAEE